MENEEKNKFDVLKKILQSIEQSVKNALSLLEGGEGMRAEEVSRILQEAVITGELTIESGGGKIIEGVFDGTHMVGADGKQYTIPPNYASKSKLVEGDMLKLTILPSGKFIYKQIGPVARDRIVGEILQDPATKQFSVAAGGKKWQVLNASITYFRGDAGDEAVILVPKDSPSKWAAVENVIKKI